MNEIIRKRKSIRKYELDPLDEARLEAVRAQIKIVTPLYPGINFSIEIMTKIKGLMGAKAPHYLVFGSQEKDGYLDNIGFVGQQMDLFFSASGLGSCWLGAARPEDRDAEALPYIIIMAFGKPAEPLHREHAEFKRKPLSDICEGFDGASDTVKACLEAARLAPSGMNKQNWFFVADNGKIHCYRKKPSQLLGSLFSKMGCINMGIALCHIAEESEAFSFTKETGVLKRKGLIYAGTAVV